ncbi:MAG: A/G-specific adenine glycosylase [Myxococcota bacterium]|nr:A/G-specific adenine glycosylase [Myxococcota bacterium]
MTAEERPSSPVSCRSPTSDATLIAELVAWYALVKRDLPWRRRPRDAYAVWVSETMLQQTRVETVRPYYERFMRELPTVSALADAPESHVLALWSGLGYYRRARMLHAAARHVVGVLGGRVPDEPAALRKLEGVGAYTAGAIASIAFGRRAALVDGNVERVLARLFAIGDDVRSAQGKAGLWAIAERLVRAGTDDPGDWNQALMELGATLCAARDPHCHECPVSDHCQAHARGIVAALPLIRPKRAPRPMRRVVVVAASSRAILLARRCAGALFGGLWEPPGTDGEVGSLVSRLALEVGELVRAGSVVHVLSHRRMTVDVWRTALPKRRRWPPPSAEYDAIEAVALDDVGKLPHSSLTRKVLGVANVPVRGLR